VRGQKRVLHSPGTNGCRSVTVSGGRGLVYRSQGRPLGGDSPAVCQNLPFMWVVCTSRARVHVQHAVFTTCWHCVPGPPLCVPGNGTVSIFSFLSGSPVRSATLLITRWQLLPPFTRSSASFFLAHLEAEAGEQKYKTPLRICVRCGEGHGRSFAAALFGSCCCSSAAHGLFLLHAMDRHKLQQRHEEGVTAAGGRRGEMSAGRRGRFDHHDGHGDGGGPATFPVVDQADCTARSCWSCVAVTLADAIALGCCPCAVVSLLGLAFVKAPLAVARRCLQRLRRRRGEMRHRKRVRDMLDPAASAKDRRRRGVLDDADASKREVGMEAAADGGRGSTERRASSSSSGRLDAEKVWMEMYRVGQWGFGRLSVSVTLPVRAGAGHVAAARSPDGDGGRRREDVDLRCES
jgi:hypothetical protein